MVCAMAVRPLDWRPHRSQDPARCVERPQTPSPPWGTRLADAQDVADHRNEQHRPAKSDDVADGEVQRAIDDHDWLSLVRRPAAAGTIRTMIANDGAGCAPDHAPNREGS